jgi:hypothetical protein
MHHIPYLLDSMDKMMYILCQVEENRSKDKIIFVRVLKEKYCMCNL